MRWGARPTGSDDYLRFSRPIRWLVCKLGRRTVRFHFYDLECADMSLGHRVLGRPAKIINPGVYESRLEEQCVIADQRRRRELIEQGLDEHAAGLGGTWSDPGDVLDEATYLVEWPTVLSGSFDEGHLRLPDDVLITAMQGHQRYFPVRDGDGRLMPAFLYVSNADPEYAELITSGNTRVLNGRLDDAAFAYDRDVAVGLDAIADRLGAVVFHERLGSLADKAVRIEALATWLAVEPEALGDGDVDRDDAALAARLAKADLASGMVQEFPTLQGRMGELYARSAGHSRPVATAIGEHYRPLSATAPLPSTGVGSALAIADKADNIVGAWVAGEKPTGSRDPYALRRAAIGIVRIALEGDYRFPVACLLERAAETYVDQELVVDTDAVVSETLAFVWERLEALLLDEGVDQECVQAALGSSATNVPGVAARARELARLRDEGDLVDVATAYTRCASLAAKAGTSAGEVTAELLIDDAERALFDAYSEARARVADALREVDVEGAVHAGAELRRPVDRYFDDVLVMDGDPDVRDNRLAQLAAVRDLLLRIGDFSRLAL
jgi:glycyl-tRNA synthetase beta chain